MDEPKLLADVRTWLEGGGFVLEMLVARKFKANTAAVSQGFHYVDPATGKEREGDVGALLSAHTRGHRLHGIDVTVECKNTQAPWVLFEGDVGGRGPWVPARRLEPGCLLCEWLSHGLETIASRPPHAYAIREKRARDSKDHAYEAVQQAATAATFEYPEVGWSGHGEREGNVFIMPLIAMPLVVTTSPLIVCALDEAGDVALRESDRVVLEVPRMNLPDATATSIEVTIVTLNALDSLIDDLQEVVAAAENATGVPSS